MPRPRLRPAVIRPRGARRGVAAIVTAGLLALIGILGLTGGVAAAAQPDVLTVAEGAAPGTQVGTVAPADAAAERRFAILAGNDRDTFMIDPVTGRLLVRNEQGIDYESQSRYDLRIRIESRDRDDTARRAFASDLLNSGVDTSDVAALFSSVQERTVVVEVQDGPEPPVLSKQRPLLVWNAERSSDATSAWSIAAVDPDAGDVLHYELLAGDDEGLLHLDPTTGRLSPAPSAKSWSGRRVLPLTVRVSDSSGLSDAVTLDVEVIGLAPAPTNIADSSIADFDVAASSVPADADPVRTPVVDSPSTAQPVASSPADPAATAAVPAPVTGEAPPPQHPAASQGELVARFLPLLGVFGIALIALLTLLALQRRRRNRLISKLDALQHHGNELTRPLPSWLREATEIVARPMLVSGPVALEMQPASPAEQPADALSSADSEIPAEAMTAADPSDPSNDTVIIETHSISSCDLGTASTESDALNEAEHPTERRLVPHREETRFAEQPFPSGEPPVAEPATEPETYQLSDEHDDRPYDDLHHRAPDPGFDVDPINRQREFDQAEVQDPEPISDAAFSDEGSYVGGWTQEDDATYTDIESSAVHEASEALAESQNPMGLDPRVAALRAQLSDMFGVRLNSDAAATDASPAVSDDSDKIEPSPLEAESPEPAVKFETPPEQSVLPQPVIPETIEPTTAEVVDPPPVPESDPVRSWLEYLKNRNSPAAPAPAPVAAMQTPSRPESSAPSPAPVPSVAAPAKMAAPMIRRNKSAVRMEISHLRDVANRHTRGVLAVKASEQKARLWWFLSGACMIVLCFVGVALLKSPTMILRWLGWAFLCGAAVNLAVCLNSFHRLKSRGPDGTDPAADDASHPPVEGEELIEDADLLTSEMKARLESIMHTEEQEPAAPVQR